MSACAQAADLPLMQPPAEWVTPAVLDPTPSKLAKDAPTAVLLQDNQVRFQPEGAVFYHEVAIKAQTPQGLAAIGSVTIPWDPATQRLIIHKLKVLRGGQEIDYLAIGPGFLTLRRETKLEAATLDGTLTATTQIEGLEVGDIMDLAYTVEHTDPIMKGHVQADFLLNLGPVHHAHLRALWPSTMKVTTARLSHAPEMTVRAKGDWTEATLDREDPADPILPKGAPARYLRGPELQFGNFANWAEVSALLSAEFAEAEASAPGSPLLAQAKTIADSYPDPKARAEAALTLVQDKIRYVLLALDGGGLKPAAADLTWTRRFADCKGKTVVLLALLHALGIEAEPALASIRAGDGLDQRLPLLAAFDHVLVRATIDGRVYWLDGTRTGDHALEKIRTPLFQWALPMRPAGAELVRLEPQDFDQPMTDISMRFDASSGLTLPAAAHGEFLSRGDGAVALNLALSNLAPAKLQEALKDYWHQRYDYIEIKSTTAQYDAATQEERLTMDGSATLDWKTGGGFEVFDAQFHKLDVQRQPGPDRDAPYAVAYPRLEHHQVSIVLPGEGRSFTFIGPQIDETIAGVRLSRRLRIENGAFTADIGAHALMQEYPESEAEAASKRLADLAKLAIRVVPPHGLTTPAERTALMASKPETREQFMARGNAFLENRKYDEALADFDKAIALDPSVSIGWADRALTWAWKGDAAKTQSDADEALRLDARQVVAFRAKCLMASRQKHWPDAVDAYSSALAILPGDLFSLIRRAEAYLRLYDAKSALRDAEAGLNNDPGNIFLLDYKSVALLELDRRDDAESAAMALASGHADNAEALQRAARLFRSLGKDDDARSAMDKAVSLKPTAEMLLARAELFSIDDVDHGLADARQALKLDSESKEAPKSLARLNYWAKNYAEALKWGNEAVRRNPDNVQMMALVGALHHELGEDAAAAEEFALARKTAGNDGGSLSELCWGEATVSFDLPGALTDCEAALKASPPVPVTLSNRAFVLMRLGRNEEALAQYDATLALRQAAPFAWYGRSIVERRIGRTEAADRDRQEALRRQKNVSAWYRFYGIAD